MNLNLNLTHEGERLWIVYDNQNVVAEIYLDHFRQIDAIVLHAEASDEIKLQILRLGVSHAQQFVKNRIAPVIPGLISDHHQNTDLTDSDSLKLMSFDLIPDETRKLNEDVLLEFFKLLRIDVVFVVHKSPEDALQHVLNQLDIAGLTYTAVQKRGFLDYEFTLEFSVEEPHQFIFWKSEFRPRGNSGDLCVIPSYHPVMKGWKSVGLINGATDAYIGGKSVSMIYCPDAARFDLDERGFGSWNHVNHPFKAVGSTVKVSMHFLHIRSEQGVEIFRNFLSAALGLHEQYVDVSGGFYPPMQSAHNRLVELKIPSPWPDAHRPNAPHLARGSEAHCVWAYRTLENEGALNESYVPAWFFNEGWLDIYKDAEVKVGMY